MAFGRVGMAFFNQRLHHPDHGRKMFRGPRLEARLKGSEFLDVLMEDIRVTL